MDAEQIENEYGEKLETINDLEFGNFDRKESKLTKEVKILQVHKNHDKRLFIFSRRKVLNFDILSTTTKKTKIFAHGSTTTSR